MFPLENDEFLNIQIKAHFKFNVYDGYQCCLSPRLNNR